MNTLFKFRYPLLPLLLLNLFFTSPSFAEELSTEEEIESTSETDLSIGFGYLGTYQGSSDSHAGAVDFAWEAWNNDPNFAVSLSLMAGALKAASDKTVMSIGAFIEIKLAEAWIRPMSFSLLGGVQQWDFNDDLTTYGAGINYRQKIAGMDEVFLKYLSSELTGGSESLTNSQVYLGLSKSF